MCIRDRKKDASPTNNTFVNSSLNQLTGASASNIECGPHLQGYAAHVYALSKNPHPPSRKRKGIVPSKAPNPKAPRVLPSYGHGETCDACGKKNHVARDCRFLAASIWCKFVAKRYPKQYKELEKDILERARRAPKEVNLLTLADEVAEECNISVANMVEEMNWELFYGSDETDETLMESDEDSD